MRGNSTFRQELEKAGCCFLFVMLAGFYAPSYGMFGLARRYRDSGMTVFVDIQQRGFS